MPPYSLPENATRSTLKSNSSKGGGGYNELRFEDKKGSEQVFLHAQKNLDQRVLKDSLDWVGGDRHSKIDQDLREKVGGDRHSSVGGHRNEKATGDVSMAAGANMIINGGMKTGITAGMDTYIKGGMNVVIEAGATITLKVGSTFLTLTPAMIVASTIPLPLPEAASAAQALALTAATGPAGVPLPPKEADDGK
jgi:type VI secretion system secreted protein VgrG